MSDHPRPNSAAICRALADPTRVRILNLLRHRHELSAIDVTSIFGLHRDELNRHIKFLERAHLISCRRVGQLRQYRFNEDPSPFHGKLIEFLASLDELPEGAHDLRPPSASA